MNIAFDKWYKDHSSIKEYILHPDGKNCRWGHFKAQWKEQQDNYRTLTHLCAFNLDLQKGDLYLDCRKRKIWAKCVVLSLTRPYFTFVKTAYHIFLPLSIPIEICQAVLTGIQQNQSSTKIAQQAWINVKYSIVDIIRTPIYGIALTIITISAVIIGPFAPIKLYDLRAYAGQIEIGLNRGQNSVWDLAPCFQPISNLMKIHELNYEKLDTNYDDHPILQGATNLLRSYVKFRRENRNIFNDCGRLLPKNKAYMSATLSSFKY